MTVTDNTSGRLYDSGHYPVVGGNTNDDGRKRWAGLPPKVRKEYAAELVSKALTGQRKADAMYWLTHRRYTPNQLENFIQRMESAVAEKEGEDGNVA